MRKMKTKLLVILCVLILAGAAMVGPVAGATGIYNYRQHQIFHQSHGETGDIAGGDISIGHWV